MGTSISELQDIFKQKDTDKLMEYLKLKRQEALDNIIKMQNIIKDIDLLNYTVEKSKEIIKNSKMKVEYFDERKIVFLECKEVDNLNELMYYSSLDKLVIDKNIETYLDRGIIYEVISDEEIKPRYAFYEVKDISNLEDKSNIKILPRGKYLTFIYNSENMNEKRQDILAYIKENNLNVDTIMEVELFDNLFNIENFHCQIQVLLEKV